MKGIRYRPALLTRQAANERAIDWVRYQTGGKGDFVTTAMEDHWHPAISDVPRQSGQGGPEPRACAADREQLLHPSAGCDGTGESGA
jgi:hypothetical protein